MTVQWSKIHEDILRMCDVDGDGYGCNMLLVLLCNRLAVQKVHQWFCKHSLHFLSLWASFK